MFIRFDSRLKGFSGFGFPRYGYFFFFSLIRPYVFTCDVRSGVYECVYTSCVEV